MISPKPFDTPGSSTKPSCISSNAADYLSRRSFLETKEGGRERGGREKRGKRPREKEREKEEKKTARGKRKNFVFFLPSSFLLPHSSLPGSTSSRLGRVIGALQRKREREREREK